MMIDWRKIAIGAACVVALSLLPQAAHAAVARRRGDELGPGRCRSPASCLSIATGPLLFPKFWHHITARSPPPGRCFALAADRLRVRRFRRACGLRACRSLARIHELHRAAVRALHGRRRHSGDRQLRAARRAINTGMLAFGTAHGQHDRHHRRRHDPDPAADPRQRGTRAATCTSSVFFIFLVANIGGALIAARRSAAVRRLPARRRFLLDRRSISGCRPLIVGALVLAIFFALDTLVRPPRRPPQSSDRAGAASGSAAASTSLLIAADHRRDPGLGDLEAGHRRSNVYGTPVALQNLLRDAALIVHRAAVAVADAERAPRGQRLHLGADRARSPSCSPAFSSPSSRCSRCCRPAATARSPGCSRRHRPRRHAARGRLFLADRRPLALPRQCADLPGVLRARRRRRRTTLMGPLAGTLAAISHGRGLHGREHLHRQRAELHGQRHRRRRHGVTMPSFFGYCPVGRLRAGAAVPAPDAAADLADLSSWH